MSTIQIISIILVLFGLLPLSVGAGLLFFGGDKYIALGGTLIFIFFAFMLIGVTTSLLEKKHQITTKCYQLVLPEGEFINGLTGIKISKTEEFFSTKIDVGIPDKYLKIMDAADCADIPKGGVK